MPPQVPGTTPTAAPDPDAIYKQITGAAPPATAGAPNPDDVYKQITGQAPPVDPAHMTNAQRAALPVEPDRVFKAGVNAAIGAGKQVSNALTWLASPIRSAMGSYAGPGGQTLPLEGKAQKLGAFGAETVEYGLVGRAIQAGAKGLQLVQRLTQMGVTPNRARMLAAGAEGVAQAGGAKVVSEASGSDSNAPAVVAGVSPVVGAVVTNYGPKLKASAQEMLQALLARARMSGERLPPERLQRLAHEAASDILSRPLRQMPRTWEGWQTTNRARAEQVGGQLETALQGPAGQDPVRLSTVYDGLEDLRRTKAVHPGVMQPVYNAKGELTGYTAGATFDPDLDRSISVLRATLDQYKTALHNEGVAQGAETITAQQLHDIKRVWDASWVPVRRANQPPTDISEQLTNGMKTARFAGANAIREALSMDAPTISALDRAYAHAANLEQMVENLAARAPALTRSERVAARTTLVGAGVAAGQYLSRQYGGGGGAMSAYAMSAMGARLGYGTAKLIETAMSKPAFVLLGPMVKTKLADAIASGKVDLIRQILTPIVEGAATSHPAVSASAAQTATRPGAPRQGP